MIRKTIILMLTLAATVLMLLAWFGQLETFGWEIRRSSHSRIVLCVNGRFAAMSWESGDVQTMKDIDSYEKTAGIHPSVPFAPERLWFAVERASGTGLYGRGIYRYVGAAVPLVVPFILFGTYPIIALYRGPLRRRRRRRKGLCLKCGYDLTGNISGTCPECGTEISPVESAVRTPEE